MLWVNFWVTFQAESELMMSYDLKRLDAAAEQSDVSECESSDDMEGSRGPAPLPNRYLSSPIVHSLGCSEEAQRGCVRERHKTDNLRLLGNAAKRRFTVTASRKPPAPSAPYVTHILRL